MDDNKFLGSCILGCTAIVATIIMLILAESIPKPETIAVFFQYLLNNPQDYGWMTLATMVSFLTSVGGVTAGAFIGIDYFKGESTYYEKEKIKIVLVSVLSVISMIFLIGFVVRYLILLVIPVVVIGFIIRSFFE